MVNRAGSLIGSGGPKILEAYSDSRTLTSSDQIRLGGTIIITAFLVSFAATIKSGRALVHLQTGNVMLRIAGHDVSRMGLLSVALVCPSELQRKSLSSARGTHQIAGVWRGCMKDGTTKSAPSDSPDEPAKTR